MGIFMELTLIFILVVPLGFLFFKYLDHLCQVIKKNIFPECHQDVSLF